MAEVNSGICTGTSAIWLVALDLVKTGSVTSMAAGAIVTLTTVGLDSVATKAIASSGVSSSISSVGASFAAASKACGEASSVLSASFISINVGSATGAIRVSGNSPDSAKASIMGASIAAITNGLGTSTIAAGSSITVEVARLLGRAATLTDLSSGISTEISAKVFSF